MGRMGAERIDAGARRRLIRQGLPAGGLATDGLVLHPVPGTPPGGRCPPSSPRGSLPTGSLSGVTQWSHGPVEAQRVGCAPPLSVGACDAQAKAERCSSVWGRRRSHAAWPGGCHAPGSSRAVGTAKQAKRAARVWEARVGGVRTARGTITSSGAQPVRNAGAPCSAAPPWVCPGRRRPGERRQPARVRQQSHTDGAEGAQSASPTPQGSLARRPRSPGALASCPTTDRWPTPDETGSPHDLSRLAAARMAEEPGARQPHAGSWGAVR